MCPVTFGGGRAQSGASSRSSPLTVRRLLEGGQRSAAQIGLNQEGCAAAEPRTIDLNALDDALDVIAGLGKRDAFDPVDWIDLGIAGIAITLNPFLDPAAAGIVAGECQHIGAVVAADVVSAAAPICIL